MHAGAAVRTWLLHCCHASAPHHTPSSPSHTSQQTENQHNPCPPLCPHPTPTPVPQVDQGLGIGTKAPFFNRFIASATRFLQLTRPKGKRAPVTLVAHARLGSALGDLPAYDAFLLGGPYSGGRPPRPAWPCLLLLLLLGLLLLGLLLRRRVPVTVGERAREWGCAQPAPLAPLALFPPCPLPSVQLFQQPPVLQRVPVTPQPTPTPCPAAVRGFNYGELAACRRFVEGAVELRAPVLGQQLYAFAEGGSDLGSSKEVGALPPPCMWWCCCCCLRVGCPAPPACGGCCCCCLVGLRVPRVCKVVLYTALYCPALLSLRAPPATSTPLPPPLPAGPGQPHGVLPARGQRQQPGGGGQGGLGPRRGHPRQQLRPLERFLHLRRALLRQPRGAPSPHPQPALPGVSFLRTLGLPARGGAACGCGGRRLVSPTTGLRGALCRPALAWQRRSERPEACAEAGCSGLQARAPSAAPPRCLLTVLTHTTTAGSGRSHRSCLPCFWQSAPRGQGFHALHPLVRCPLRPRCRPPLLLKLSSHCTFFLRPSLPLLPISVVCDKQDMVAWGEGRAHSQGALAAHGTC